MVYSFMFALFIFGFILPFMIGVLTTGETRHATLVCNGLGVITTLILFIFEVGKLRAIGMQTYFSTFSNWLEILMFPVFSAYTVLRFMNPGSVIPEKYTISETAEVQHYAIQAGSTFVTFIMFCWTL